MHVGVPEGVTKEEVSFRLTPDHISIGVGGAPPLLLLEGRLHAEVQPDTSTWVLAAGDKRSAFFDYIKVIPCSKVPPPAPPQPPQTNIEGLLV